MRADLFLPLMIAATVSFACGARPPPQAAPPVPAAAEVFVPMEPHWDQPCFSAREPVLFRVEEVIDTAGLHEWLDETIPSAAPGVREEHVDIGVIYSESGRIRSVHLQEHTVDSLTAQAVEARVGAAVRRQGTLLEPHYLRIRLSRPTRIRLLPALRCMPHIEHEGLAPAKLGEASVSVGRLGRSRHGDGSIGIRLHLARDGTITEIEFRAGDPALLARVRPDLAAMTLNPALMNGEPVRAELDLILRYPLPPDHDQERPPGDAR